MTDPKDAPSMQPPHLKPQPAFVPEPLPVRLAAMIVSYRKVSKWADANRIEEQLAALEKRAPVLVPAPELARLARGEQSHPTVKKPPVFDDIPWDMDMVPE